MARERLDDWLLKNHYYSTRARARDAIARGCVSLASGVSAKPSRIVMQDETVRVDDPAIGYVSRAALKLVHALELTGYSPRDRIALDLGASTGGFCQVLLETGATRVYGIDVGHGQLDPSLGDHERLVSIEGLNARDLSIRHLDGLAPGFLTSDVSFISLELALPPALGVAAPGAVGIFLVKPQFEVGREALGKGGIVRDPVLAKSAAERLRNWLDEQPGWRSTHLLPSPIEGGDGNREFLLAGIKNG